MRASRSRYSGVQIPLELLAREADLGHLLRGDAAVRARGPTAAPPRSSRARERAGGARARPRGSLGLTASNSTSTRSPAASSPSPRGTSASAAAPEHRGEQVRLLRAGRRGAPAGVGRAQRARAPPARAAGSSWTAASSTAVAARRLRDRRPRAARSAGRAKSWKVTMADTGLPGRPKTSVPSRTPNQVGLPGLSAHAPEALLDAELGERALHVVVRAHRDAARDAHHVGRLERPRERRRGGLGAVGHRLAQHHLAARRARPGPRARTPFELWIWPGPSGGAGLHELVAGHEQGHPGRRAHDTDARPSEASTPDLRRPELGARREHRLARPARPRRRGARWPRARLAGTRTRPSLACSVALDRHHRVRARRHRRAGRDRAPRCPARPLPSNGCPARASPTTSSSAAGPATSA